LPLSYGGSGVKDKKKTIVVSVAVLIAVAFISVIAVRLIQSKLFAQKQAEEVTGNPVSIVEARTDTIRNTLFFTGDIHAEKEVLVYSLVTGRLVRYNYKEGQEVAKGAPMAILEHEETWDEFKPIIVMAPISGRVAANYLDIGERATPQTPLSLLVGGSPIKVFIRVPDTELSKIAEGMKVDVTVPTVPGVIYKGVVERISPVIERSTRTSQVEIAIKDHDDKVRAGMFGDATIILSEKADALVIPFEALLFDREGRQGPYCYIIIDNTARRRSLTLGTIEDEKAEVISGLAKGDRVVTLGKESLSDGTPVAVIPSE
jgi:multidrug efflux pump subunit AcrA (membrane-fusion protein)